MEEGKKQKENIKEGGKRENKADKKEKEES